MLCGSVYRKNKLGQTKLIIYRCGGHKTIKQSKKIVIKNKIRIVVPCGERVGERGILIEKQNQN